MVAGIVGGDEGDAGAAVAARAAEVESVDSNRQVAEALGPRAVRAHQVGVKQSVAKVAGGGAEHGVHVVRRKRNMPDLDVLEVRGVAADLVDYPVGHLVLEVDVLIARGLDGKGV